jgi:hypothetical protein
LLASQSSVFWPPLRMAAPTPGEAISIRPPSAVPSEAPPLAKPIIMLAARSTGPRSTASACFGASDCPPEKSK